MTDLGLTLVGKKNAVFSYDNDNSHIRQWRKFARHFQTIPTEGTHRKCRANHVFPPWEFFILTQSSDSLIHSLLVVCFFWGNAFTTQSYIRG